MNIDQETIQALANATVSGSTVHLLNQMDRPLYVKVDKVLRAAGGKWDRRLRCHIFEEDPAVVLDQAVLTGQISSQKQELGVFYTPAPLAARAAAALRLDCSGLRLLEPSAGMGALAKAARQAAADALAAEELATLDVTCFDILPKHVSVLRASGFHALCTDFLDEGTDGFEPFDRILMNPPFAGMADAAHFLHALDFLKPGGRIVSIMSAAVAFRDSQRYRTIRALKPQIEALPGDSFKESGTSVNTCLVIWDKPS